jgi:hypothetical protein
MLPSLEGYMAVRVELVYGIFKLIICGISCSIFLLPIRLCVCFPDEQVFPF